MNQSELAKQTAIDDRRKELISLGLSKSAVNEIVGLGPSSISILEDIARRLVIALMLPTDA